MMVGEEDKGPSGASACDELATHPDEFAQFLEHATCSGGLSFAYFRSEKLAQTSDELAPSSDEDPPSPDELPHPT
jgi:hypothetical protein